MGFTNNLFNVASSMQQGTKNLSISVAQRALRLFTGFFIGMVLALVIQEFTQSGLLMLVFFTTLFMVIVYKLLRAMSMFQIFIFNVICILIATALRMYIMIAP